MCDMCVTVYCMMCMWFVCVYDVCVMSACVGGCQAHVCHEAQNEGQRMTCRSWFPPPTMGSGTLTQTTGLLSKLY